MPPPPTAQEQKIVILDWDDTLLPTWYITDAGRLGAPLFVLDASEMIGRADSYATTTTTTTLRGWCIEAVVSILVQSQPLKSLPGGGGV